MDILKHEELLHRNGRVNSCEDEHQDLTRKERFMRGHYDKFIRDLKAKTGDVNVPRFRRFNMILDRREDKQKKGNDDDKENEEETNMDDFYMFSAADDCNKFDYNNDGGHVPEVFIGNSKKSTLPKKGYKDQKEDLIKRQYTFSASEGMNGKNFILSFHVQAVDNIKCYVYHNGTSIRFFPEDMVNVWPKWFNMTTDKNKDFISQKEKLLDRLKNVKIRDDAFEQWYRMTTGFNDLHQGMIPTKE